MIYTRYFCISFLSLVFLLGMNVLEAMGQTGLSVSPPRSYFTVESGKSETKKLLISNPSKTHTLELSVSLGDWEYDSLGNNVMKEAGTLKTSSAGWIEVLPQSFFSIAPGTSHEIEVKMTVPDTLSDEVPVHTTMLYVTQINPVDGLNEQGANIRAAIQSGVKLFHRKPITRKAELDIQNFRYQKEKGEHLKLYFENTGNVWIDGTISCELLNQSTGEKIRIKDVVFYSMPGDQRVMYLKLPEERLSPGKYMATALIEHEHAASLQMAELIFNYEKSDSL